MLRLFVYELYDFCKSIVKLCENKQKVIYSYYIFPIESLTNVGVYGYNRRKNFNRRGENKL